MANQTPQPLQQSQLQPQTSFFYSGRSSPARSQLWLVSGSVSNVKNEYSPNKAASHQPTAKIKRFVPVLTLVKMLTRDYA
jgi:hypothetical protein